MTGFLRTFWVFALLVLGIFAGVAEAQSRPQIPQFNSFDGNPLPAPPPVVNQGSDPIRVASLNNSNLPPDATAAEPAKTETAAIPMKSRSLAVPLYFWLLHLSALCILDVVA